MAQPPIAIMSKYEFLLFRLSILCEGKSVVVYKVAYTNKCAWRETKNFV